MSYSREMAYFRKRASEEHTAALHAPTSQDRKEHRFKAEKYEERVRSIAMAVQERTAPTIDPVEQNRLPEW